MHDEARWRLGRDVREWRGRWPARSDRSVVAVQGDGAGNRGIRALEAGLEHRIVGRESCQRREMTARGASREEHGGRVGTVLAAVLAHPADHLLHVDQRIGELRCRTQAVVRADAQPAVAGEPVEQVASSETLAAETEASWVEVDQHWATRTIGAIAIEVEQVSPARGAVPGYARRPGTPACRPPPTSPPPSRTGRPRSGSCRCSSPRAVPPALQHTPRKKSGAAAPTADHGRHPAQRCLLGHQRLQSGEVVIAAHRTPKIRHRRDR